MYKPREGRFLTHINAEPSARERHGVLPSGFCAYGDFTRSASQRLNFEA
jgi:hypothetical protein